MSYLFPRALALVLCLSVLGVASPAQAVTATIQSASSTVSTSLNALGPKATKTKLVSTAVRSASRNGARATAVYDRGRLIGFDLSVGKAKACLYPELSTKHWYSALGTCRNFFFAPTTSGAAAKATEVSGIGKEIIQQTMSAAAQRQVTPVSVVGEVLAGFSFPADVSYELVGNVILLRSAQFPTVRLSFTLP